MSLRALMIEYHTFNVSKSDKLSQYAILSVCDTRAGFFLYDIEVKGIRWH